MCFLAGRNAAHKILFLYRFFSGGLCICYDPSSIHLSTISSFTIYISFSLWLFNLSCEDVINVYLWWPAPMLKCALFNLFVRIFPLMLNGHYGWGLFCLFKARTSNYNKISTGKCKRGSVLSPAPMQEVYNQYVFWMWNGWQQMLSSSSFSPVATSSKSWPCIGIN